MEKRAIQGAQTRMYQTTLEARSAENEESNEVEFEGYAAVFNQNSEPLGYWYRFLEKIEPGAFDEALLVSDVRVTKNHDANMLLGRTSSGTGTVTADGIGLKYGCRSDKRISYVSDTYYSAKRGDINQSSFVFELAEDGDEWDESGEIAVRTIKKVARLHDVSIVTYPAYTQTLAAARNSDVFLPDVSNAVDFGALNEIMYKSQRGLKLDEKDWAFVQRSLKELQELKPGVEPEEKRSKFSLLKRELEILASI